jgi:hypothetical protein
MKQMTEVSPVHYNVQQEFIVTTEDKVHRCLGKHLVRLERRREWVAPLGIGLTVLATLLTTSFKTVGFKADVWEALFIIFGILMLVWFVRALWNAKDSVTVEMIIDELKRGSQGSLEKRDERVVDGNQA